MALRWVSRMLTRQDMATVDGFGKAPLGAKNTNSFLDLSTHPSPILVRNSPPPTLLLSWFLEVTEETARVGPLLARCVDRSQVYIHETLRCKDQTRKESQLKSHGLEGRVRSQLLSLWFPNLVFPIKHAALEAKRSLHAGEKQSLWKGWPNPNNCAGGWLIA